MRGGVEWLEDFQGESADDDDVAGFTEFFESVDCLVTGATTYEQALTFGEWPYDGKPTYVFTHRDLSPVTGSVEFVARSVADQSTVLKRQYDHIWLVGGAQLAQTFLDADETDELRLSLVPILLGGGGPLFAGGSDRQRLRLLDTRTHDTGVVETAARPVRQRTTGLLCRRLRPEPNLDVVRVGDRDPVAPLGD